jgi:hypothetical protein
MGTPGDCRRLPSSIHDTRLQGPHQHADAVGRVIRLCLALDVGPVFAPPRATGFQAASEGCNAPWQAKVWARFHHDSLPDLQGRSARSIAAHHRRAMARIDAAPPRRPLPRRWRRQLDAPLRGHLVYRRRTRAHGTVPRLGHTFTVDPLWPHRLVRCEVDVEAGSMAFYAWRRREPSQQPLLRAAPFVLPPSVAARGRCEMNAALGRLPGRMSQPPSQGSCSPPWGQCPSGQHEGGQQVGRGPWKIGHHTVTLR